MQLAVMRTRLAVGAVVALCLVASLVGLAPSCSQASGDTPAQGADSSVDGHPVPESGGEADSTNGGDSPQDATTGWDVNADVSVPDPWIFDPTVWKPVDGADFSQCRVFEAIPERIQFPPLAWAPCGAGCESVDIGKGYELDAGYFPVVSTAQSSGVARAYLTFQQTVKLSSSQYLELVREVRLDDGVTLALLKTEVTLTGSQYSPCAWGRASESALVNRFGGAKPPGDPKTSRYLVVTAPLELGPWTWGRPALLTSEAPSARDGFDTEDHRRWFGIGMGAVHLWDDPSSSAVTTLETNSASLFGAGQGDLAIWTDYGAGSNPQIRGWHPDGGVRTILDGLPQETCRLSVTPTHLVGMMGSSIYTNCTFGWYEARFWSTPRAYSSAEVKLTLSPNVPGVPLSCARISAWGDFVACSITPWSMQDDGQIIAAEWRRDDYLLITQLSTWKMWRLSQREGYLVDTDAVTVTPTHLYTGVQLDVSNGNRLLRTMYRYELSQIDSWATALGQ